MTARRFAIAGTVSASGLVLYWTGAKRMPWTTMESRAKSWGSQSTASQWLSCVTKDNAVADLRVVPVAAP